MRKDSHRAPTQLRIRVVLVFLYRSYIWNPIYGGPMSACKSILWPSLWGPLCPVPTNVEHGMQPGLCYLLPVPSRRVEGGVSMPEARGRS